MREFLYRRIINNKWLFLCLLIGAISTCAIFSTVPMYSKAILQKVLTKDLKNYHAANGVSPAEYRVEYYQSNNQEDIQNGILDKLESVIKNQLVPAYGLPEKSAVKMVKYTKLAFISQLEVDAGNDKLASMVFLSDINKYSKIISGRMPVNNSGKEVSEVIVIEEAIKELDLLIDNTYEVYLPDYLGNSEDMIIKIKVVGVFSIKDTGDLYWSQERLSILKNSIIIDENISKVLELNKKISAYKMEWDYYFDYSKLKVENVEKIIGIYEQQIRWTQRNNNIVQIFTPLKDVLMGYKSRETQLRIILWILFIPLIVLLCLYSHLISDLIVKNESNEIAVLKGRGASTIQIFSNYVIQSMGVVIISVTIGLVLALFICRILGMVNGFLEFINRESLQLEINIEVILYSLAGGAVFMLFMLIPALNASNVSIVEYKKNKIKSYMKPFWQKFNLDILIMGLSIYGLYRYQNRQEILNLTGLGGTQLGIDPLLYFISIFFILGSCLILLRIYPLIISLIFKIGKRWWGPVSYFVLVNVSRTERNSQVIMLFLMLTLAFGVMNANQARTINKNIEDKVMYKNGADVVIEPYNNLKHKNTMEISIFSGTKQMAGTHVGEIFDYEEPPYEEFKKIKGIEGITKVFVNDNSNLTSGLDEIPNIRIMGVIPYEFGQTAWFRNGLLPYHINTYLNTLTNSPAAVFLSSNIKIKFNIEVGDTVKIKINDYGYLPFVIGAFIDYFPSCNPYIENDSDGQSSSTSKYFAVFNYSYIEKRLPSIPYEIWIKKNSNIQNSEIYSDLEAKKLKVERADFALLEIINKRNDPVLQGTNGVLTMCFIITMLITFIGFIIFWILSLKDKALKFGLSRAIGMSMNNVTLIMAFEQLLISGCAIAAGILLGNFCSRIFIPMLMMVYSSAQQVPPFKVIALQSDYIKVMIITLSMFISAIVILYVLIKRIKVNQILKLGED